MIERIKYLWANQRLVLIAFLAVIGLVFFFGAKTISSTIYWMDPAHQDQDIAPWMTPRYVAQSYKLPPEVLDPALFIERDAPPRRISLGNIAFEHGLTMEELQARIDAAAAQWRADRESRKP